MFDPATLAELRATLRSTGCVSVTDALGRRLYVASTRVLGENTGEVLIAYQNVGCAVLDGSRPLSAFQLVTAGFQMANATVAVSIFNQLFQLPPVEALPPPVKTAPALPRKRAPVAPKAKTKARLKPRKKAAVRPKKDKHHAD